MNTITGSGGSYLVNNVALISSSVVNFLNSAATNGITLTFTNASAGNIQLGFSGNLTLSGLAAQGANTVVGNGTGSSASPTALAMPSCSGGTNALTWTTATGFGCNSISGAGTTFQVNGTGLISSTTVNFQSSGASNGITITQTNGSAGNITLGFTGNLTLGGLATQATNTVVGNPSSGTTTPSAMAMPSCSGASNALIWTTNTGFGCNTISASSVSWSSITNPTTTLALTMGNADTTVFTYGSATSTTNMMTWTDTAANTGTGIIGHFVTASGSSAIPWQADANGVGWKVNSSGQLASTSTGNSTIAMSGATSGTITVTVPSTAGTATVTWGNSTGTPVVTASAPLAINTTTGNITVTGAAGQVLAGSTPAFTATPTLGASGTIGTIAFGNATSGTVTLGTVTGALGSVTASLPANTGTIAEINLAQTFSAVQTISATNGLVLSAMSGTTCLEQISGVVTSTGSACGSGGNAFPETVSGTVTSGGIPYFSATTTMSSSGILNTNILVKGGGAGGAPTNSSVTDNGTTVSTAENITTTGTFSVGSSPPACTAGTAGGVCFAEGTALTNVASTTGIYADSTSHELKVATNGSSSFGTIIRAQPGAIRSTGLVASVSTATLCAASAGACNTAGTYHIHMAMYQSGTACTSNATGGVSFQLTWTDANGTSHSAQTLPIIGNSLGTTATGFITNGLMLWGATTLTSYASGDINIDTNGTVIQYATTFSQCSTTGTATYALSAVTTRLQ